MKKSALVICPGRGTYNAAELGYLYSNHSGKTPFIMQLDALRRSAGQATLTDLDQADSFTSSLHLTGDNASLLIYGCAMGDFQDIIVYPITNQDWQVSPEKLADIDRVITGKPDDAIIKTSIRLGGLVVFAANRKGLSYLQKSLTADERFPMRLAHHGAFHSEILDDIVPMAQAALPQSLFTQPNIPMIDGQGHIWNPGAANLSDLYHYTLGDQINTTFDFSKAVEVGVKEYAPDVIIILGPGSTLGGPTAQELIKHHWEGLASKSDFKQRQSQNPYIISMNITQQRALAV